MKRSLAFLRDELLSAILPESDASAAGCVTIRRWCTSCGPAYATLHADVKCTNIFGQVQILNYEYGCGSC